MLSQVLIIFSTGAGPATKFKTAMFMFKPVTPAESKNKKSVKNKSKIFGVLSLSFLFYLLFIFLIILPVPTATVENGRGGRKKDFPSSDEWRSKMCNRQLWRGEIVK